MKALFLLLIWLVEIMKKKKKMLLSFGGPVPWVVPSNALKVHFMLPAPGL